MDFISKQPQSGIFKAAFLVSPLLCAGCVGLSRTSAVSGVGRELGKGVLLHGGRKRRGGGKDPPGSLQLLWRAEQWEPGEGM